MPTRADAQLRRRGLTALAILLGCIAVSLIITWRAHLGMSGMSQTMISAMIDAGIPGLYLAYIGIKSQPDNVTLDTIADQLASEVQGQWQGEIHDRDLNSPYLLPVSWDSRTSVEDWNALQRVASNATGSLGPSTANWARGPESLAGSGRELPEVLKRIPTGRLVVLGEPGAGKTVLMIRLVLDLLSNRKADSPIPVLCPVASWDPVHLGLNDWLAQMLPMDHPFLAAEPPPGIHGENLARALLDSGKIMPVLDGLDEIPNDVRVSAVARLDEGLAYGEQFVATCRTREFKEATVSHRGGTVRLRGAAVIELLPLNFEAAFEYLMDSAPTLESRMYWTAAEAKIRNYPILRQALQSPLMVSLARSIYNTTRNQKYTGGVLNPEHLTTSKDPRRDLLRGFIPAVYQSGPDSRWNSTDSARWLKFLACHLETTIKMPDLILWDLAKSIPHVLGVAVVRVSKGVALGRFTCVALSLATAVITGLGVAARSSPTHGCLAALAAGLAVCLPGAVGGLLPGGLTLWVPTGLAAGLYGGLIGSDAGGIDAGLAAVLVYAVAVRLTSKHSPHPARSIRVLPVVLLNYSMLVLVAWLTAGAWTGIFVIMIAVTLLGAQLYVRASPDSFSSEFLIGVSGGFSGGVIATLVTGMPIGPAIGSAIFLTMTSGTIGQSLQYRSFSLLSGHSINGMTPPASLALERQTVLVQSCGIALGSGLLAGLAAGETAGLTAGVIGGIAVGAAAGLFCSPVEPRWPSYVVARLWLALNRDLPWSLMTFLTDAHHRGVLRQVGAMYQFRHIELQRELAAEPNAQSSPTAR